MIIQGAIEVQKKRDNCQDFNQGTKLYIHTYIYREKYLCHESSPITNKHKLVRSNRSKNHSRDCSMHRNYM